MIIAYVTSTLPYGHGETFMIAEIDQLRRLGHDVIVAPTNPRGGLVNVSPDWFRGTAVERPLSLPVVHEAARVFATSGRPLSRMWSLLRTGRSIGVHGKNAAVMAKGLWLAGKVQELGIEHIHATWASCPSTVAMIAGEFARVPWSFTAHRWDIEEDNLLDTKAERASFIRFISLEGRRLAAAAGAMRAAKAGRVVHVGVKMPTEFRGPLSPQSMPQVLLCPANLLPIKGHTYLVQAMKLLKDLGVKCELWLAGDGELCPTLKDEAAGLGVADRIRFLGYVPHRKLIELYAKSAISCVVLSSHYEGIPVALMEAMSFGVPVIATETGGIPELISGGCGVLVPPRDPLRLAHAIAHLFRSESARVELGDAGRRRVAADFDVQGVAEKLDSLFRASALSPAWASAAGVLA